MDAITLACSSVGSRCPIGVRAHSTRGIASSWSSGVSMSDICEAAGWSICKVLQPGHSCGAGHSPFCLIAIFRVHLTIIVQVPSFAWAVHKVYGHQVSLWDNTRAMDDPLRLTLCLVYSMDCPGLIPHESWFRVVPHHSTA